MTIRKCTCKVRFVGCWKYLCQRFEDLLNPQQTWSPRVVGQNIFLDDYGDKIKGTLTLYCQTFSFWDLP